MKKSKLLSLLVTFTKSEWIRFEEFIASPFFNKTEAVIELFHIIKCSAPDFELTRHEAFNAIFPGEPFKNARLGQVMNQLLSLAEQFLAIEQFQADKLQIGKASLHIYSNRSLEKHFSFLHSKMRKELEEVALTPQILLEKHQLEEVEMHHFAKKQVRQFNPKIPDAYNALNDYYYTQLIKYACSILNLSMVVSSEISITPLSRLIIERLLEMDHTNAPILSIYLKIYQAIREPDAQSDQRYSELAALIDKYESDIEKQELREIYLYIINISARKIRDGHKNYVQELLKIYEKGINSRVLFEGEYLSHWTYTNVVKLGLGEKRYEWTKRFIDKHKSHLPPNTYSDAYHFNKADLYFYKGEYGEVKGELQRLTFSDPYYKLGSRLLLLKTYYEEQEVESLLSLLASFTVFLKRDKNISTAYKDTCLNFCRLLHQLLKDKQNRREQLLQDIKTTQPLAERPWLLKVWEEQG